MTGFAVSVGTICITGFDFQEVVDAIYRIYEKERGEEVEFSINITGGTNLMAAASCSCAFFIGAAIYYVMNGDGPVKEQVKRIPVPKTPNVAALKEGTRGILRSILRQTVEEGYATTAELTEEFGMSKQALNHQLGILAREGLVERGEMRRPDGTVDRRYRSIVLTPQGRLIASWI